MIKTEKELRSALDVMKEHAKHDMKDATGIMNDWITIAHDRQMQPQFRLFWYLRDMLDGTFVAEEQKHEAICFLRDKCKEKNTIIFALKEKGEI